MSERGAALAIALGLVALAGCSAETRQKLLPRVFDGVPEEDRSAPPPTRRVRQDLQREVEALRREVAELRAAAQARADEARRAETPPPVEQARSWDEARQLLPRDRQGAVDWTRALDSGAIRPRPGINPGTPAQAVFALDVELARSGSRFFALTERHAVHTRWLACGNCHPAVFPIGATAPRATVSMTAIRQGQACGACHGRVAFGVEGECARCHPNIPATDAWRPPAARAPLEEARAWTQAASRLPQKAGAPDWEEARARGVLAPRPSPDPAAPAAESLDLDVERTPKGAPEFKVIFRHASHTAWLACETCHTALFEMQAGATPMSMDRVFQGELCGRCHGNVAFPLEACARCHPAQGG